MCVFYMWLLAYLPEEFGPSFGETKAHSVDGSPSRSCCKGIRLRGECRLLFFAFSSIVLLLAVELLEGFELLYQGLVLVFQHGHSVLQALDVFFLLAPTLSGRLPILL